MQERGKRRKLSPDIAPPTTLLATKKPASPGEAPNRCAIDPLICFAIDGLIEGLEKVHFPMETLSMPVGHFKMQLKLEDFEMPENVWILLQDYTCEKQAEIIMEIIRNIHLCTALNRLKMGEGPLGSLKGREHLALPIELAGATHFRGILDEVKPLLPKFGLDKGATQGKTGGQDYPSVINLFFRNRKQFFKVYGMDSQAEMYGFLTSMSRNYKGWPKPLSEPFRDGETARDAINQIAVHYF